ncbi:hypothetical protein EPN28_01510, partial [Patescibacteria group bacterium]
MKKLIAIALIAVSLALVLGATDVLAQQQITTNDIGLKEAGSTGLGNKDVRETTGLIIKTAMGLLGIVAVVIILIGGFTWMTAGGNDEKVTQGKKWIFS